MAVIEQEREFQAPLPPGPPDELDEVGKNILAAAQIIRERGKCEGSFRRDDGSRCVVGAGMDVLGIPGREGIYAYFTGLEHERLSRYVHANTPFTSVTGWSDAHTAEEVVAGMEEAAWLGSS